MAEKSVDGYVAGLESWQAEIVSNVRRIVLAGFVRQAVALNLAKGDPTKGG